MSDDAMSDRDAGNRGESADDPFAPAVVEDTIARSLRPDAPATPSAVLVRTVADAYALPPAADAVLARGRGTLARHAAALNSGRVQMISSDTWPEVTAPSTRPPQPLRRPPSRFGTAWRAVAAVLVIALLGGGFFALLRGAPRLGGHPTATGTATPSPVSATPTPGAPTPTASPTPAGPQPPAPAGVYVTMPGSLILLNPSTGAIQYRHPFDSSGQVYAGAPVVANGAVYFAYAQTVSPWDSGVDAISATSGAPLWRSPTAARLTQLTLADGMLFGGTMGTGTGNDTFYALRASDGAVVWTFHTSTLRANAVVAGGVVYVSDQPQDPTHQHIHALRAADGSQLWDVALPQACGTALFEAVDQGTVFLSCGAPMNTGQFGNGVVYALRASDGGVLWHDTTDGQPYVIAAGAGLVYVSRGGKDAAGSEVTSLDALDESSGAERWHAANASGWPIFDGTRVYAEIASGSGFTAPASNNLAALSASSGTVLWTYPEANQRVDGAAPVVAGGMVYQALNERIVAISAANGVVLWRSPTLGSQAQGVNGVVVVTGG
ncbi:MAG TPA: PQQ-binding-like beta-propeller repeat protein [Ktedonobacterales bacterium]|jgi:outer membrane protein assembly factor BamB